MSTWRRILCRLLNTLWTTLCRRDGSDEEPLVSPICEPLFDPNIGLPTELDEGFPPDNPPDFVEFPNDFLIGLDGETVLYFEIGEAPAGVLLNEVGRTVARAGCPIEAFFGFVVINNRG